MLQLVSNYGSWLWEIIISNNKDRVTTTITTDPAVVVRVITISVVMLACLWLSKLTKLSGTSPALPPGPRTLPIVGYLPFLRPDLHMQLTSMGNTYGPIFKFYIGSKLQVVINTPELIKEVVRHQDEIFANRNVTVAASVFSSGGQDLVFSKYDSNWRKLRKIFVDGILSNKNLEACGYFRKDEVRKTIKNVFSKVGTAVNISEISFLTSTNVVKRMIWENSTDEGAKYNHLGTELQMVSTKIVEIMGQPNLSDFFPCLSWFDIQGVARNMKMQLEKLDRIFTSIIDDRVKSNISKLSENGIGQEITRKDFLQILLELKDKKSLTITEIKSLLLEIMIGATESTTTLIEWTMAEILQNPKVKKRILEELEDIVGINNIVEESHLGKLEYLDATIKETFRLHPVTPYLIPREPSQDCIVGGFKVPKGSVIFLNVWSVQRDPRYWDNPLDFYPERFLSDTKVDKFDYNGHNTKFMPFGSGRRVCAGLRLAEKIQMFILASLLHSFDWCLPEGEEHDLSEKFGITLSKKKALVAIPSQRLPDVSLYL